MTALSRSSSGGRPPRRTALKAGLAAGLAGLFLPAASACTPDNRPGAVTVAGGEPGGFYLEFATLLASSLQRHGVAEAKSPTGRDADRRLTAAGIARLVEIFDRARAAGVAPDVIVSSPYVRAIETARLAAERLEYGGELLQSSALMPDQAPVGLWEEARALAPATVLLVAHEPLLSAAASWMLGETRVVVAFGPGTLLRIDCDAVGPQPRGALKWKLEAGV